MGWSGGTYTRSDGVFTGTSIWQSNRDAGTKIVADRHDTHDQDLATGINQAINKDGSNAFTGAANLGSPGFENDACFPYCDCCRDEEEEIREKEAKRMAREGKKWT